MIKVVLQAIPTYTMSLFKLLKNPCNIINVMLSRFWWSSQQEENKIKWRSWEKMLIQKSRGEMGFRDLESFNKALLAKQGWRFLQNPQSMAAISFKEKYF